MPPTGDRDEILRILTTPPSPGTPYSVPLPGTEVEGRTPIYRHWRYADGPLLETFDPSQRTAHDVFEASAQIAPNKPCLGARPWDPITKTWKNYEWITYAETAERRKNFGAGLVELHKKAGIAKEKYGVGLWCQNCPEWQLTGKALTV